MASSKVNFWYGSQELEGKSEFKNEDERLKVVLKSKKGHSIQISTRKRDINIYLPHSLVHQNLHMKILERVME